jgi:hypothetical protein
LISVVIFCVQSLAQILMYRARVVSHGEASDLIVFALPCVVGFAAHLGTFKYLRPVITRTAASFAKAAALALAAWLLAMFVGVNFYGE